MIYIASDHGGFNLKESLKKSLIKSGKSIKDLGPKEYTSDDDYPDYVLKLEKIIKKGDKAILICTTGHGMNIASNKIKGIYSSIAWNLSSAKYLREHNNSNVLCLPAKFLTKTKAKRIVKKWLETKFSKEKRHKRRLNKIKKIEQQNLKQK
jgi:RpiB/LacA/LacB family sugar-phosphate isomerase